MCDRPGLPRARAIVDGPLVRVWRVRLWHRPVRYAGLPPEAHHGVVRLRPGWDHVENDATGFDDRYSCSNTPQPGHTWSARRSIRSGLSAPATRRPIP